MNVQCLGAKKFGNLKMQNPEKFLSCKFRNSEFRKSGNPEIFKIRGFGNDGFWESRNLEVRKSETSEIWKFKFWILGHQEIREFGDMPLTSDCIIEGCFLKPRLSAKLVLAGVVGLKF